MATSILPPEISSQLSRIERTFRSFSLLRGTGLVLTVLCLTVGACLLIDYLVDLGILLRVVMLVGVGLATLFTIWKTVIRPLTWKVDETELAAIVESAHPDLDERLTSTLELNDPNVPEQFRGSELMRSKLEQQTRESVRNATFSATVSAEPMQKALTFAALAGTLLLVPLLIWPNAYQTLMHRFFQPWANIERVTNLHFEIPNGNRVVAKGSDVEIKAIPQWHHGEDNELPESVMLNQIGEDGRIEVRRMRYNAEESAYYGAIPHVLKPFDYEVIAGSTRSATYSINVVVAPAVKTVQLNIEPPAYTGLPATLIDGAAGQVEPFEHSELTFDLEFSKPVETAEFVWMTKEIEDQESGSSNVDQPDVIPCTLSSDGTKATLKMAAERSGRFAFRIVDEHGLENEEQADRYLALRLDAPPVLSVAGSDAPDEAHQKDVIPVLVAASDDIGLGELELHIEVGHNEGNEKFVRKMQETVEEGPNGKLQLNHQFLLNLSDYKLPEGVLVAWRVRAADQRPVPGPNETWSQRRFLTISNDASAPGTQQLAFEQNQLRDELDRIIKKVTKDRDDTQDMKETLKRHQQSLEDNNPEVEKLADSQAEVMRDLNALNEKLAQHPLFESLVEKSREVAGEVLPEAKSHFEDARKEEDNFGWRANKLSKAHSKLNEANWRLQNIRREFEKLAEIERDLLELQRLANQAEQLAENTEQMERQKQEAQALPEGAEKDQAENSVQNQQQQLAGEHDQLTNELNDLLDRRPEVLDAAKRAQMERLLELAEQAQQLVDPQRHMDQAFRDEGRDIANDLRELNQQKADALAEARKLANEAKKAGAPQQQQAAEDAIEKAADSMRKGDLAKAEELFKQAMDDLDKLSDTLRKPSDPKAAVEKMAKQQEKIANELRKQAESDAPAGEKQKDLDRLAKRQEQLQKAISNTQLPEGNEQTQQQAANQAQAAKTNSEKGDADKAANSAEQAKKALEKLAEELPSTDELRKQAGQKLADIRKQQEANREQTEEHGASEEAKNKQQDISRQLSELTAPDASREAAKAAERSGQASSELDNKDSEKAVARQEQVEQEIARMQEKLAGKPTSDQQLQNLQRQQQQVSKETKKAFSKQDENGQKAQAQQQQKIAEDLAKLDTPGAKQEQKAAVEAARKAAEEVESGDRRASQKAQGEAHQAMNELAKKLGQPQASQPGEGQQGGEQQQREQLAEKADALQEQIGELSEQLEKAREDRMAANQQSGNPAAGNQEAGEQNAGEQNAGEQNAKSGEGQQQATPLEDALKEQRALASEAGELAREANKNGQKSDASRAAQTMAQHAKAAAMNAQSGRFNAAKDVSEAAAREAKKAQQAFEQQARTPQQGQPGSQQQPGQQGENQQGQADQGQGEQGKGEQMSPQQMAEKAADLNERMQQSSEKMAGLAKSQQDRHQAQMEQQQALEKATQEIAKAMQDAAEKLQANPLDMQQNGQQGQKAAQSAQQAAQSQQQAQSEAKQGNAMSAAQQAAQAAQNLQKAAQQARQAGSEANKFRKSPVPDEVGTKVAEAVEQLRKAGEKIQKDIDGDQMAQNEDGEPGQDGEQGEGQDGESGEGQEGQQGEGQEGQDGQPGKDGKKGEGKPGEGKQGEGQQGEGKGKQGEGEGKPGEGKSQKSNMKKAAESLAKAAKGAQPKSGQGGDPSDKLSENMQEGPLGEGADQATVNRLLPGLNPNGRGRQWGKLPDNLKTEFLEPAKKNPNGEYAKLIKLYFKEIAGSGKPVEGKPVEGKPAEGKK